MELWSLFFSVVAVLISGYAVFVTLPKISITGSLSTVFDHDGGSIRPMVIVTVVNDGGAAAHVSEISLRATDGSLVHYARTEFDRGPKLPVEIPARGGRKVWMVDYQPVRELAASRVRDSSPVVRATVKVGSRFYHQRGGISVPVEGASEPRRSALQRLNKHRRRLFTTRVIFHHYVVLDGVDLESNTAPLRIEKRGFGLTKPYQLTLVARHPDGRNERVQGVSPIRIPRMFRPRLWDLQVPLVDDSGFPDSVVFSWLDTAGTRRGGGTASTRSGMVAAKAAADALNSSN
jgi:hypothetical protein